MAVKPRGGTPKARLGSVSALTCDDGAPGRQAGLPRIDPESEERPLSVTSSDRVNAPTAPLEARVRAGRPSTSGRWPRASYPANRREPEPDSPVRTPFQRDRDRIVHSKAFRRLKHKTQVFIAPEGDHYRTRLTHTLETCGISRTVARALGLNEDLTEAIGLGHDLGHPPFGHIGEEVLDQTLQELARAGVSPQRRIPCGWSTCSSATGRGST